jgi:hypothetical protein
MKRLEKGLQVPPHKEYAVEAASPQLLVDAWCVNTCKAAQTRLARRVLQELVAVAGKQIYIPREARTEAGTGLVFSRVAVGVENGQVEVLSQ